MNLIPNYEEVVNLLEGLYDFVIDEGVLDVLESAPASELRQSDAEALIHLNKVKEFLADDQLRAIAALEDKMAEQYEPAIEEYQQLQRKLTQEK